MNPVSSPCASGPPLLSTPSEEPRGGGGFSSVSMTRRTTLVGRAAPSFQVLFFSAFQRKVTPAPFFRVWPWVAVGCGQNFASIITPHTRSGSSKAAVGSLIFGLREILHHDHHHHHHCAICSPFRVALQATDLADIVLHHCHPLPPYCAASPPSEGCHGWLAFALLAPAFNCLPRPPLPIASQPPPSPLRPRIQIALASPTSSS